MREAERRAFAPSAERNAGPILDVLRRVLPARGRVLEIASGTGQHVVAFAAAFPGICWRPSDPDPAARASIAAWTAHARVGNVGPPLALDVSAADWEAAAGGPFDAVLAINMIHIAPWSAALGLFSGAARVLAPSGVLYLYGPYLSAGRPDAPGNLAFDRSLRSQNPDWGVRELPAVASAAETAGLALREAIEMPTNNLSLVLSRR